MPELDAEHRDQLARAVHEAATRCAHPDYSDPPCEVWADALAPLVAGWLAEAEAAALREAAAEVPLFEFMLVMDVATEVAPSQIGAWLRDRADRIGGGS